MTAHWSSKIVTERIGGVPYRVYAERPRRLADLLAFASQWGDRPYAIRGDEVLTFAQLQDAARAKALSLAGEGVGAGDHVFILGWNGPEWVVNFWACQLLGAVPVLGNAWWSEGDLAYALELTTPVLVLADARCASRLDATVRAGAWGDDGGSQAARPLPPQPTDENDPAVIIFTSGTEGRAKAVVLSHRSFLASMLMMLDITRRLPFAPTADMGEICLHTGPLFHIGGPHALLRGVATGNTLVFLPGRFDPGEILALIERHEVARWTAVPTMVTRLLDHPDLAKHDLHSLKAIGMGGAPVHAELLERLRSSLPDLELRTAVGYGLSENAGQATAASGKSSAKRPGSAGRPLPLVEIRFEPRDGLPDGEVLVRSPSQMLGYLKADNSPIDAEGWLHTGDLGRIDDEGLLWITGRCKDIIIRGGENIAPAAVEKALLALPEVAEAAVVGVPHADLGEEVMAFVVIKGAVSAEALAQALKADLPSFAIPSRWSLETDPLPTNQTGKVAKAELAAKARADLAAG